jgi:hypothetical protein
MPTNSQCGEKGWRCALVDFASFTTQTLKSQDQQPIFDRTSKLASTSNVVLGAISYACCQLSALVSSALVLSVVVESRYSMLALYGLLGVHP